MGTTGTLALLLLLLCTPCSILAFMVQQPLRRHSLQARPPPLQPAASSSSHRTTARPLRLLQRCATPPTEDNTITTITDSTDSSQAPLPSRDIDFSVGLWPKESRLLLALLGGLGFLETAYLTYQKLTTDDLTSLCTAVAGLSMKCGDVLNSEFASFLDVPLTLPGAVAYASATALALWPLMAGGENTRERAEADSSSRAPLLILTTAMATFSGYFMWVLATQIKELCPYCLASASLSFSMVGLTWSKNIEPNATKSVIYKGGAVAVTGLFSVAAFAYASAKILVMTQGGMEGGRGGGMSPPAITTHSTARSEALAVRLAGMDAKMYGAFWCSHCYEQKQAFGQESFYRHIKYIECAPDGAKSETKVCKTRKVPGYPTWEIKGDLYPGEKSLEQLEDIVEGRVAVPPLVLPK
ncbi:Hypothetical protein NocV09_01800730 [Nannochloropsis oceanica]